MIIIIIMYLFDNFIFEIITIDCVHLIFIFYISLVDISLYCVFPSYFYFYDNII